MTDIPNALTRIAVILTFIFSVTVPGFFCLIDIRHEIKRFNDREERKDKSCSTPKK